MSYDLVIRGGTILDGLGGEPFIGDVAVTNGIIVAVGDVAGKGAREHDATGKLVTPGFVDIHTHYDGQAIWSQRLNPSSRHGVTTVVMGNCGVGFAPCRPEDHETLIDVMEGVEDIPGVVMAAGLPWTWETFPEYLDALDERRRDIDVAAFLPHSPLRVFVMGERGANREPATADDLAKMRALAAEAVSAGALGFASSRSMMHQTGTGHDIPSYDAAVDEVEAIARGLVDAGGGILQFVPEVPRTKAYDEILSPMFEVAKKVGLPMTFTMGIGNASNMHEDVLVLLTAANASGGDITGQVLPRPVGLLIGLELSAHPFVLCPTYKKIAHLPLAERVAEMRKPEVRAQILSEQPDPGHPLMQMARNWRWTFPIGQEPNYEPAAEESLTLRAEARGVTVEEEAYDRLLDDEGRALFMVALANFNENSLDAIAELHERDDIIVGLGDGGAHYGMICDATYTTFMLTHWARDREGVRMTLPHVVRALSNDPAEVVGLKDRGRIARGYKADINVIDFDRLKLLRPEIIHDLPGGGKRLDQRAIGFAATFVAGEAILIDDHETEALPGKLVRGRQMPVATPALVEA